MTVSHHPADETLASHASGSLDEARRFVVAVHLASCASCRKSVAAMQTIGGAFLDTAAPLAMAPNALQDVLAKLDVAPGIAKDLHVPGGLPENLIGELLRDPEQGRWTFAGPGLRMQSLYRPNGDGARLFMLKAAPGLNLPNHTHTGAELTLVLKGAFTHSKGRFGPGDCEDADDSDVHMPVVEPGETCVCLVAMEGQLKLRGLLGRLAQPFVRI